MKVHFYAGAVSPIHPTPQAAPVPPSAKPGGGGFASEGTKAHKHKIIYI
eukprot:COSAG06_NODE_74089_length_147_cov_463.625000_1_plen_48_part_11